MSRIGRIPIELPPKVKVKVEGRRIFVEGPKGKLYFDMPKRTQIVTEDSRLLVQRDGDDAEARSNHGLTRSIVYNLVKGVHDGFVKKLEIHGVGFKAASDGKLITMNLGYSHTIRYPIPEQIKVTVEDNTRITVEGPSKEMVGRVASELRSYYPPEPYKGKGVRYSDEKVLRKEGKTVQ